jgi:tetratricopeptide (TPR) repeat protein
MEQKDKRLVQSDLGFRIAQQFSTRLKTDVRAGGIFRTVNIGVQIRGPDDKLPLPIGKTPADLEAGAQELGEKINAHIVIYGSIENDVIGTPVITPKFFISQDAFGDAQEILGENELGGPFRLTGKTTSGADLIGENKNLRSRVEVLSLLLKGLTAFVGEDFPLSLNYFGQAQSSNLWEDTRGKEVVYMLAGNTSARLANYYVLQGQLAEADSAIMKTEEYYKKALDSRPDYARAYLGLGNVEYYYATRPAISSGNISDIDTHALEKVDNFLQSAINAKSQPSTADIKEKVAFNKAQAELISFQLTRDHAYLDKAIENYFIIVNAFDHGNVRLRELAAHAHSGLGLIYRIQKKPTEALSHYESAISLTHSPSMEALYIYYEGRTYLEMKNVEEAKKYYQAALDRYADLRKRMSQDQILKIQEEASSLGLITGSIP